MGKFSPSKPPAPEPPPPLPKPDDPEVERRKEEVNTAARRRKGLLSTVKTSGLGDTSEATNTQKTLLGE